MNDVILKDVVEQVEAWTVELAGWMDRVAPSDHLRSGCAIIAGSSSPR
jgi:hypothetical protein